MTRSYGSIIRVMLSGLVIIVTASTAAFAQAVVAAGLLNGQSDDRVFVLVRLDSPFAPEGTMDASRLREQRASIARTAMSAQDALIRLGADVRMFPTLPWIAAEIRRGDLAALAAEPSVAAIEPDVLLRPVLSQSVPRVGAPPLWQAGHRGAGWTVAVLDTGVDSGHAFLGGAVVQEACFSTTGSASASFCPNGASSGVGSGTGSPCDPGVAGCSHGTHVAGIAVGRLPADALYGVAPAASLLPVQVFSRFDQSGYCSPMPAPCALALMSDVARGLDYVMTYAGPGNGRRVAAANLSLAGGSYTDVCDTEPGIAAVKAAIDNLRSIGVATTIAAGNEGRLGALSAPACISTAISVGSTETESDALSSFSNRSARLLLTAPGGTIWSSIPGGGFTYMGGTSMAAPHVAGAWALLKSVSPSAPVEAVLQALRDTGEPLTQGGEAGHYPRIDVNAAAARLGPVAVPGPPAGLTAAVTGATVTLSWQAPASGVVSTYVLEAGSASGGVDVFQGAVGPATRLTATVAAGRYYVRVRAQNAAGSSAPSNEVTFAIATEATQPPGPPSRVSVWAAGTTVIASWDPPATTAVATGYIVQVGTTPGASDVFSGAVGHVTAATGVLPVGTYYMRVFAQNGFGTSPPSPEATLVVDGSCPIPDSPSLTVSAAAGQATLSWGVPGGSPLTQYVLEAGTAPGASDYYTGSVGTATTLTAAVPAGTYYVRVRARSQCGLSAPSAEARLVVP